MERDDWHLLKRYAAGECPPEEAARVPAEFTTEAGRRAIHAVLRAADLRARVPEPIDAVGARERLEHRLAGASAMRVRAPSRTPWLRGAAVGTVAAILLATAVLRFGAERAPETEGTYHAAPGQRSTVRWADGSTMTLAPMTSVTATPTGVRVIGEAYFSVASRSSRPFVVRTSNAVVQVLGTRFSVRQYPGESRSRVVVDDGRVALHPLRLGVTHAERTVLSERMLALVTDSGVTVQSGIISNTYTGWVNGTLVFDGTSLREAAVELSRAYGVEVRVADSVLASKPIIAEVAVHQRPLAQVLDAICDVMGAHVVRDGASFVLSHGRRTGPASRDQIRQHPYPQPEKQQYGR